MPTARSLSRWATIRAADVAHLPTLPGVYVIYGNGELQYVGQSNNLRSRLRQHVAAGLIAGIRNAFGRVTVKFSPARRRGDWLAREYRLILRLQPPVNITGCGVFHEYDLPSMTTKTPNEAGVSYSDEMPVRPTRAEWSFGR